MENEIGTPNQIVMDATCYESELRYPTIQKLLWECVHWIYKQLRITCKELGIAMIRSKYLKWKHRYQGFSKIRKNTKSRRVSLTRALLKLLIKFIDFEKQI